MYLAVFLKPQETITHISRMIKLKLYVLHKNMFILYIFQKKENLTLFLSLAFIDYASEE